MNIKAKIKNSKNISNIFYFVRSLKLRLNLCCKKLTSDKLRSFTHYDLYCTKVYGKEKHKLFAESIHKTALESISAKEKIKIGFVVYSADMWSCSKLYSLFEADSRFEPFIIVCSMKNETKQAEANNYNKALDFFTNGGYRTVAAADCKSALSDCGDPDILIYLTPYTSVLTPGCFNISNIPLDKLTVYIPYSIIVSGNESLLENPTINLAWKFFCESRTYLELMREKSPFGGYNTVYTGFPGIDALIEGNGDKQIFKAKSTMKKIIYAPHFSVGNEGIGYSTFAQNHKFMLELAKATKDRVSWVIKPHPRLKTECIKFGIFENEEGFDEYISAWDNLPNAKSVFGGGYNDLFAESDAIILDSASFLAEYQFTGNPLLFLTNSRQKFNSFGQAVLNTAYKADGSNFNAIEHFVTDTVLNSEDPMKTVRKEFFDTQLNYVKHNGGLNASEKIYSIIKNEVCNGNNN